VALKNPGTPGVEEYTVILTSPGRSSIESEPTRDSIIVIDVPPGTWNIEVRAEGPEGLTALGEEKVEVKPGETNTVHVKMYPAAQVNKEKTFSDAFAYFEDLKLESGDLCYIEITESITADKTATLSGGKNITLRTHENVIITRGNQLKGSLFQINGGSKLTLGGVGQGTITIEGNETSGNESLIKVSGTLVMHDGVTLTKNEASSSGGGVYVDKGGQFIMEGGTISGNISKPEAFTEGNVGGGGGVYIHGDQNGGGEFIMNGGTISGNVTSGHGGGVRVYTNGTFTMNGGTISDNSVSRTSSDDNSGGVRVRGTFTMNGGTISGNSAPSGGGIGIADDGTTNPGYGTFIMKGGTISGNTATSSNGGGVRVFPNGTFTKTGGTIYGNNDNNLKNTATVTGQAVYAQSGNTTKVKNTTAGPGNSLSSSPGGNFSEGWDQ
jgi:hypothetical protein